MSETDLINILTNTLRNNKFSHCRLCLKVILDEYVRLDSSVCLYPNSDFVPLIDILNSLLDGNINDETPGLEAVCTECAESALITVRFLDKCKHTTRMLNTFFENITNSINIDSNSVHENNIMYIVINNVESKLILTEKPQNKGVDIQYYECSVCDNIFETFFDVKAHNLTIHRRWTCNICYETFLSERELLNHEVIYHKDKYSEYQTSEESLKEYQDGDNNLYVCKDCGKACKGLDKLHIHEEKHKTKSICPKCGKSYTTKEFFERHVELCLKDMIDPHPIRGSMEKSFVCEKCEKAYSTQGGLRVHARFAHGNAKPHVCKECGKKFTAPSYLKLHMVKHTGEKNFKCDICSNRFVSKEALLYHTRRHTGEKPYSCKICNERFVNASARAEHIKFKHVGPTLMCEICSRKFVTTHFLKQHISRHHDPSSKLYYGRNVIPPNMPAEQNLRKFIIKTENS